MKTKKRGVVTQDLTKIHAANPLDKDEADSIHWKKYEIIAEALGPVALFQSRQNPFAVLPGSGAARQMILDCPRLDEDVSRCFFPSYPKNKNKKRMDGLMDVSVSFFCFNGRPCMSGVYTSSPTYQVSRDHGWRWGSVASLIACHKKV